MSRVCRGLIYNFFTYNFSTYSKNHVFYRNIVLKYNTKLNNLCCTQFSNFHTSSLCFKRRKTKEERKAPKFIEYSPKSKNIIINIWKNMTVAQLAQSMSKDLDHVFEVMLYVDNTDNLHDEKSKITNMQVIQDIVKKSGMRAKIVAPPDTGSNNINHKSEFQDAVPQPSADPKKLKPRPPVVTVMGHVDHGKTTLLDSLRHTHVVQSEFGGITQHIGAFSVTLDNGAKITFLDTPGHAAFKAMRARGANATDIVVLVVAADDGVMEQTVESIRMAREANVPIIVAINKIDKPESNIERTVNMLAQHSIQVESLGGDIQAVPVSALKGTNLEQLTESIALQAEILDLKADPSGLVEGVVIESSMDPHRGKLSTLLVQRGTLHKGSVLVCDTAWAKVRAMFDQHGQAVTAAPPSTAVEVLGWRELPPAGHIVLEVDGEKRAHEIVKWRGSQKQEEKQIEEAAMIKVKQEQHIAEYKALLEKKRKLGRFKLRKEGPRQKEIQVDTSHTVHVLVKGDVDGTVEAILDVLETYDSNDQCKLDVVHYGIGNISEFDIELAESFNAVIYAFNIECPTKIEHLAASKNIPIKFHNVIYKLVDDLKEEINLKLPLLEEEQILGEANVLQQFMINDGRKKIPIAGSRCVKGVLKKNALYRLIRSNETIHEGRLESMRHLKNEVDKIKKDVECGLQLVDKTIEFAPGDTLICYEYVKVNQKTDWDPGF